MKTLNYKFIYGTLTQNILSHQSRFYQRDIVTFCVKNIPLYIFSNHGFLPSSSVKKQQDIDIVTFF